MNYFRDCLHLIDVLSIRHHDLSCDVALHKIALAEYHTLPECDISHPGPGMVEDGDGGTKMLLDSVEEDLTRAYQELADLNLQRPI